MGIKGWKALLYAVIVVFVLSLGLIVSFGDYDDLSQEQSSRVESDIITMESLHIDAEINKDNTINVVETFSITFNKRGLTEVIRSIPYLGYTVREKGSIVQKDVYMAKIVDIDAITENNEKLNIYKNELDRELVIGIKDNHFIPLNETRNYVLHYTYELGLDYNKGFDDFYFNIVGTSSAMEINNVSFTVSFPSEVDEIKQLKCYYGREGATKELEFVSSGNMIAGSCDKLNAFEGITIRAVYDDGFILAPIDLSISGLVAVILSVLTLAFAIVFWLKLKQKSIIIPVEVVEPEGLTPSKAEFFFKGEVSNKSIIANIICLANKGYIKINQSEKDIELEKVKDVKDNENQEYKDLYNTLFKKKDKVNIKQLGDSFGEFCYNYVNKENIVKKAQLYEPKHKKLTDIFKLSIFIISVLIIGLMLLSTGIFFRFVPSLLLIKILCVSTLIIISNILMYFKSQYILSIFVSIVGTISLICFYLIHGFRYIDNCYLFIFAHIIIYVSTILMIGESKYKEEFIKEKGRVLGFKNFILMCEVKKLKMFVEENPSYYFDVLPYAYIFNLSDEWINKFEKIKMEIPDSYINNSMVFMDYMSYRLFMKSFIVEIDKNTRIATQSYRAKYISSSGGSSGGFGGGGFSGGGSGGGGFGAR